MKTVEIGLKSYEDLRKEYEDGRLMLEVVFEIKFYWESYFI